MSNNIKYIIIAVSVAAIAYFLYKKQTQDKK
jgi:hypothetical protein